MALGLGVVLDTRKQGILLNRHNHTKYSVRRAVRNDEIGPEVKIYPDYCNSIFYVFNVATASKMVEAAKVTQHAFP